MFLLAGNARSTCARVAVGILLTSLRPERPREELEQPSVLHRRDAARHVAVRAHERGMPQPGPLDNADRKGPEARGLLGYPRPFSSRPVSFFVVLLDGAETL